MAKRQYTQPEIDLVRAEYEAWDPHAPNGGTVEDLLNRIGEKLGRPLNKPMLYLMRRRGWRADGPDTPGPSGHRSEGGDDLTPVVRYLTEQLVAARVEVSELTRQLEECKAELEARPPGRPPTRSAARRHPKA